MEKIHLNWFIYASRDLQISGSLAVLLEAIFLGCKFRWVPKVNGFVTRI